MKKLISSLLIALFGGAMFLPLVPVHAAGQIAGFEIIAPSTAKANEAIDVTVRAVDKNKETVTDYRGSIIFISDTFGDTVPSPGKAIAFTQEDAGQKKFSKGVIFRSAGKQKIYVADVENSSDIIGETTVMVEAAETQTTTTTETVTIVSPVKDSKITTDSVAVSGQTKKNSKVTFWLNGKEVGNAITSEDGLFTKTLTDITQEKNLLQIQLLDGNNQVIAKSEEILFEKAKDTTGFYNLTVTPGTSLETSAKMSLLVEGDAGMTSASVLMDGSMVALKETQPGKYTAETVAPAKAGIYPLSVTLVTSLAQTIEKKDIVTLTVTEPVKPTLIPRFTDVKSVIEGQKITFTFKVVDAPLDLDKFKIAYGESADSLSQEVMTYSTGRIMGTGGVFTWYIPNLEAKTFTFKIFGAKADNSLIPEFASEPITATIGKDATVVANIAGITATTTAGKTTLSWEKVECATSYNVYKLTPAGDYVLVQNTQEPSYTIFLQTGAVAYDNFAVKALCADGQESPEYTQVSRVQTGPGMIAILVILSGILGILVLRKRSLS